MIKASHDWASRQIFSSSSKETLSSLSRSKTDLDREAGRQEQGQNVIIEQIYLSEGDTDKNEEKEFYRKQAG